MEVMLMDDKMIPLSVVLSDLGDLVNFLEVRSSFHRDSAEHCLGDICKYWYLQGYGAAYDILAIRLSSVIRELSAQNVLSK